MVHQSRIKKNNISSTNKNSSVVSDLAIINCFVGSMLRRGKKQKSANLFFSLLYVIRRSYGVEGVYFIRMLLDLIRPKIFLSSKKIAGVVHKIPTPITLQKSYSIAIHWIISSAKKRGSSNNFFRALVEEFNDIYKNPANPTIKKRDEFHKTAYINKPFLRFYKF